MREPRSGQSRSIDILMFLLDSRRTSKSDIRVYHARLTTAIWRAHPDPDILSPFRRWIAHEMHRQAPFHTSKTSKHGAPPLGSLGHSLSANSRPRRPRKLHSRRDMVQRVREAPFPPPCPAHDRNPRPNPTQLTSHRLCSYDPNTPAADQLGQPWLTQRQWSTIDPVFSVADPHLACNNPGAPPPSYIPIAAGDNITAVYWYAKPGLPIPSF